MTGSFDGFALKSKAGSRDTKSATRLSEGFLDAEKGLDEIVDFIGLLHVDHVTCSGNELCPDRGRQAV
jgi:hypothetical protein